jgi:purine nucleosidase/pyrimidine-specific ribonucleoside hydrolase
VFPLAGVWTGTTKNGTFVMQATITIHESCQVGGKCGTFDIITIPCSGTFSLVAEDHGIYEFLAGDQQGTCGKGRDFLQLLPDGTLQYTSRGDYGETLGILKSQANAAAPNPSAKKLLVIYEDDGSPDGTTALLYLLSNPAVEVKAAAVSYGEAHPAIYAQFIGRKLDDFGITDIPLGAGQDYPLSGNTGFPDWLRQSADTFWGLPVPTSTLQVPVEKAPEFSASVLKRALAPITIFISGPATDLAQALRLDPSIKEKIAAVYMMGGAVYVPGNISDFYPQPNNLVAEWNVYVDPEAAKEVFDSGLSIYLVPLDATNQVTVDKQDISQWRKGGEIANFAGVLYGSLLDSTGKQNMAIWDLMTSAIMVQPDLCGFKPLHLQVVTSAGRTDGQTMVVNDGKPNVNACLEPNGDGIRRAITTIFSTQQ